jgi:hypothetical protein
MGEVVGAQGEREKEIGESAERFPSAAGSGPTVRGLGGEQCQCCTTQWGEKKSELRRQPHPHHLPRVPDVAQCRRPPSAKRNTLIHSTFDPPQMTKMTFFGGQQRSPAAKNMVERGYTEDEEYGEGGEGTQMT